MSDLHRAFEAWFLELPAWPLLYSTTNTFDQFFVVVYGTYECAYVACVQGRVHVYSSAHSGSTDDSAVLRTALPQKNADKNSMQKVLVALPFTLLDDVLSSTKGRDEALSFGLLGMRIPLSLLFYGWALERMQEAEVTRDRTVAFARAQFRPDIRAKIRSLEEASKSLRKCQKEIDYLRAVGLI
jgi:hypothetical protein